MKKPIRVFYSTLSGRFYATAHYKEVDGHVEVTGKKYDVTNDIGAAVCKYDIEFQPARRTDTEGGEDE